MKDGREVSLLDELDEFLVCRDGRPKTNGLSAVGAKSFMLQRHERAQVTQGSSRPGKGRLDEVSASRRRYARVLRRPYTVSFHVILLT